jgi:hypothetical protein
MFLMKEYNTIQCNAKSDLKKWSTNQHTYTHPSDYSVTTYIILDRPKFFLGTSFSNTFNLFTFREVAVVSQSVYVCVCVCVWNMICHIHGRTKMDGLKLSRQWVFRLRTFGLWFKTTLHHCAYLHFNLVYSASDSLLKASIHRFHVYVLLRCLRL